MKDMPRLVAVIGSSLTWLNLCTLCDADDVRNTVHQQPAQLSLDPLHDGFDLFSASNNAGHAQNGISMPPQ
jgi:hypothetical protein